MRFIKQTNDVSLIKSVLSTTYDSIAYDGSPSLEEYVPTGVWFILKHNTKKAGFIQLLPITNVMWQCHVAIFKEYRGNGSEEWGQLVAEWARDNLGVKRFLAITPYKAAKHYAERVGFSNVTILKKCIQKNGVLLYQYVLEME